MYLFKFIRPLIALIFSITVLILTLYFVQIEPTRLLATPQPKHTVSLQWLRRDELAFLVTERIVTQVVVEQDRSSFLLGRSQGYLVATARLYYGIDLSDLNPNDITDTPTATLITLPRPRFLDAAIDPDDRYVTKRSGLMWLRDNWIGQNVQRNLRMRAEQAAYDFATEHQLIPNDQVLLDRLAPIAELLAAQTDKSIRFAYRNSTFQSDSTHDTPTP